MSPCRFPKKHIIIGEGTAPGYVFFIENGMTRSYWMVDGSEITTAFSLEGDVEFSMDELYYGRQSEEYLETIEPVDGFRIRIDIFRHAITTDIDLCNWWATIHQNDYRRIHRSHKERLTLPARERYAEFESQFPEICRRARLTDIASYLGITLPTLSRIRRSHNTRP